MHCLLVFLAKLTPSHFVSMNYWFAWNPFSDFPYSTLTETYWTLLFVYTSRSASWPKCPMKLPAIPLHPAALQRQMEQHREKDLLPMDRQQWPLLGTVVVPNLERIQDHRRHQRQLSKRRRWRLETCWRQAMISRLWSGSTIQTSAYQLSQLWRRIP